MDKSTGIHHLAWVSRDLSASGPLLFALALAAGGCAVEQTGLASSARTTPATGQAGPTPAAPGAPSGPNDPRPLDAAGSEMPTVTPAADAATGGPMVQGRPVSAVDAAVDAVAGAAPTGREPPGTCPVSENLTLCLNFEQALLDGSSRPKPVMGTGVDFAASPTGRAARFARPSALEISSGELYGPEGGTIELWLRPSFLGRRMGLVDGPYRLSVLASGSAMCVASGGYALFNDAVRPGSWTSLACTFDENGIGLWVDGRNVRQTATSIDRRSGSTLIGTEEGGTNGFDGLLDNVRIWRVVRTASQICGAALSCAPAEP
jgi:hypothetical protein